MTIILLRHGIAADLTDGYKSDAARPLTTEGVEKTRRVARGLVTQVGELNLIATSPKLRARQTAELVARAWGRHAPETEVWPELARDNFAPLLARICNCGAQTVLCAGHEPNLSHFTAQVLTGKPDSPLFDWKKAGACALELDPEREKAVLLWLLTARQLRKLAKDGG